MEVCALCKQLTDPENAVSVEMDGISAYVHRTCATNALVEQFAQKAGFERSCNLMRQLVALFGECSVELVTYIVANYFGVAMHKDSDEQIERWENEFMILLHESATRIRQFQNFIPAPQNQKPS